MKKCISILRKGNFFKRNKLYMGIISRNYKKKVFEGETYYFCKCGKSSTQPLCDEISHEKYETNIEPIEFIAGKSEMMYICPCGKTIRPFNEGGYCLCVKIGAVLCFLVFLWFCKSKFYPWIKSHFGHGKSEKKMRKKKKKEERKLKRLKRKLDKKQKKVERDLKKLKKNEKINKHEIKKEV